MWAKSAKEVSKEVKEPSDRLTYRVLTFISRFGFLKEDVLKKIQQDDMFAAHFAKEPRRTGLHEKMAARWIEKLSSVKNFVVLPKTGAGSIKISSDGKIACWPNSNGLPGKTLDFRWCTGDVTFYAMHKYTKEGGGNQDSQFQEMIEVMKKFLLCVEQKTVLAIIVDGNYYRDKGNSKLSKLKKLEKTNTPESYATPIEGLPEILSKYVN